MLQVLYLDFDGVLHHDAVYRQAGRGIYIDEVIAPGRTLFEWRGLLISALAPYPAVRIVLSTSWVRTLSFSRTVKYLGKPLGARVIGATYHSVHHSYRVSPGPYMAPRESLRGEEVVRDVARRRPSSWVAIDDTDEGWPDDVRQHLVLCKSDLGLGDRYTEHQLAEVFRAHWAFEAGSTNH